MPQAPSFQARITSLLVCGDAFRDEKGRIHVYGIFDTIGAAAFPISLSFTIFAKVQGEGSHTAFFKVVDSLDEEVIKTEAMPCDVTLTKGHNFLLGVATRFLSPGLYRVKSFLDGVPEIEVPLMIRQVDGAPEQDR